MSTTAWNVLLAVCVAPLFGGCAHWESVPEKITSLPTPNLSPDSVVLEIAMLHVPPDVKDLEETVWTSVDEQSLPNDLRRRLRENGFRYALLGVQIPERLRELLDRDEAERQDDPELATRRRSEGTWHKRLQSRSGKRQQVVASAARAQIDVIMNDGGSVVGSTCYQAHCEFALRTFPQGDGSVRIELTPEIHHGPPRQRYVGDNYSFIVEQSQERMVLDQMRTETVLSPGQSLLVSCTPEVTGLGRHFFGHPDSVRVPPKLLLIRLAQTQSDDLFNPERDVAPIATPTD